MLKLFLRSEKKGDMCVRRGFEIKENDKILVIEDVITTGKSSLECVKLIKKANAKLLGFCLDNR